MFKLFAIITVPTVILISQAGYSLFGIASLVIFYIISFYIYERSRDNQEIVVKEKNSSKTRKLNKKSIIKESSFFKTLSSGVKRIEEILDQCKLNRVQEISGKQCFELYDSFGFPIDLTRLIASENNLFFTYYK